MSFVDRKLQLFDECCGDGLIRRRSEARLKQYGSVLDTRAWCNDREEQRKYILELILKRSIDCQPKIIPIEFLIRFLMAEKDALIAKLQNQVNQYEQGLKYKPAEAIDYQPTPGLTYKQPDGGGTGTPHDSIIHKTVGEGDDNLMQAGKGDTGQVSDKLKRKKTGEDNLNGKEENEIGKDSLQLKKDKGKKRLSTEYSKWGRKGAQDGTQGNENDKKGTERLGPGKTPDFPCICTEEECKHIIEIKTFDDDDEGPKKRLCPMSRNIYTSDSSDITSSDEGDTSMVNRHALQEKERYSTLAEAAIKQLERIKNIVDEKGDASCSCTVEGNNLEQSKHIGNDIVNLENEIEEMSKKKLDPLEEADKVRMEVEVLKKYVGKLCEIQKQNSELKIERDMLKSQLSSSSSNNCLCYQLENLNTKVKQIEDLTKERDKLKNRVKLLENELQKYRDLPERIDNFKNKSAKMIGNYTQLKIRFQKMTGLENDVKSLKDKVQHYSKKTSKEIEELDTRCKSTQEELGIIENEICLLTCKLKEKELEVQKYKEKTKDMENIAIERNCLAKRLESLKFIYEDVAKKVCGCEEMKKKLCELMEMEKECCELREKAQKATEIEVERDALKDEVDYCQCLIQDNEEEIGKLLNQIDLLTSQKAERGDQTKILIKQVKEKEKYLMEKHKNFTEKIKSLQNYVMSFKAHLEQERIKNCQLINEFQKQQQTALDANIIRKENIEIKQQLQKTQEANKTLSDALDNERKQVKRLQHLIECSKLVTTKKKHRPPEAFFTELKYCTCQRL